jgi:hypothetical protein
MNKTHKNKPEASLQSRYHFLTVKPTFLFNTLTILIIKYILFKFVKKLTFFPWNNRIYSQSYRILLLMLTIFDLLLIKLDVLIAIYFNSNLLTIIVTIWWKMEHHSHKIFQIWPQLDWPQTSRPGVQIPTQIIRVNHNKF